MSLRRPPSPLLIAAMLAAVGVVASTGAIAGQRGQHPAGQSQAQSHQQQESAPRMDQRERGDDPLSDSVRRIERQTRGQILSAERVPFDGRSVNRIKIVDDRGRVRVYMDDPQSPRPPEPRKPAPTRGDDD